MIESMSITEEERKNERVITARKDKDDDIEDEIGHVSVSASVTANKMPRFGTGGKFPRQSDTPKVDPSSALDVRDMVSESNYVDDEFDSISESKSIVNNLGFGSG